MIDSPVHSFHRYLKRGQQMWFPINLQDISEHTLHKEFEKAGLVTFTKEILNVKLHFFCSDTCF